MLNGSKLDKSRFFPEVFQVVPTNDYKVFAYFNDGSIHCMDIKPLIKPDTVFEPLADIDFFKTRLAVINYTVAWDIAGNRNPRECLDLDPFTVFESPTADEQEVLKLFQ